MKTKIIFLLSSLAINFAILPYAQAASMASENNAIATSISAVTKTRSLTIKLSAQGNFVISSDQDQNFKNSGKLTEILDVLALEKKLQEIKNGVSDVVITIKTERGVKFQYLVDVVSMMVRQAVSKIAISTETSLCIMQIPLGAPAKDSAYMTIQISAGGDYALQLSDKGGKFKSGNVIYRREKIGSLADTIVQAKKTNADVYAFINADKDSSIQAYVDVVNMLNSASINKYWILAKGVEVPKKKSPDGNESKTQQQRIDELEAQQKELLERVKKISKR